MIVLIFWSMNRPIRLTQCCTQFNLPGLRFFVYCICIIMWHSHLNGLNWVQHWVSRIGRSVTSRLDYCSNLVYGLPNNLLHKLQRVQNAVARLICNLGRFDHIPPTLFSLHWLPIRAVARGGGGGGSGPPGLAEPDTSSLWMNLFSVDSVLLIKVTCWATTTLFSLHWPPIRYRIQFKISLFTYEGLNGLAPAYITELLKRKTIPWYNLRSSDDKLLLHAPSQYKNSRYFWWPFIYRRVTKTMERSTCGYPPCH